VRFYRSSSYISFLIRTGTGRFRIAVVIRCANPKKHYILTLTLFATAEMPFFFFDYYAFLPQQFLYFFPDPHGLITKFFIIISYHLLYPTKAKIIIDLGKQNIFRHYVSFIEIAYDLLGVDKRWTLSTKR